MRSIFLYCPLGEPLSGVLFHANNKIFEILQMIYLTFCNNTVDEMARNAQNVSLKQSGFCPFCAFKNLYQTIGLIRKVNSLFVCG